MTNPRTAALRKNRAWFENYESRPVPAPEVQDEVIPEPAPTPRSIAEMSFEEYGAFRASRGIGRKDEGIFGSRASWNEEAGRKSGRTAMVTSNVEPSPAVERVYQVQINEGNLDRRPLADRFGNASNAYRYEG
jgi:hypothetical protein